ncbi:MAG: hypothetical protein CVT98_00550 [Bacteroidetes bacterium HGW-Bacteroidetes-15]|nr:MAG: hypothetical protein CVT98_00550 [Bacteroidetes bacterium HGW-Bacteroidetes-15]
MSMRLPLYFFVAFTFLTSCQKGSGKNDCADGFVSQDLTVKPSELLNIPLTKTDAYLGSLNQIEKGGKLYRISRFGSKIDVYDLVSKNKIKSYSFHDSGPNHISAFGGIAFMPLGGDSLLFMNNISQLYLTHKDSILLKKTYIEDDLLSPKEYRSYGVNQVKPFLYDNKVFFIKISQYLPESENGKNDKILMYYDLQSKNLLEAPVHFPGKYREGIWTPAQRLFSFANHNSKVVLNFPIEDDLYIYDTESNAVTDTVKCVTSRYKKSEIQPINREITDWKMYGMYLKKQILYWSISYNPAQQVYYRIIVQPVTIEEDYLSEERIQVVSPFSVMVLDKDFNVLAEDKFPGKTYDLTDFFVTDKGLWISNNNPENPNFSEDQLSFTLFALGEKKE